MRTLESVVQCVRPYRAALPGSPWPLSSDAASGFISRSTWQLKAEPSTCRPA